MIKPSEVNPALIQQAVDELEIGVPIRAWEVQNGELLLHLAYGQVASWSGPNEEEEEDGRQEAASDRPWFFGEAGRVDDPPTLPTGSLNQKTRQQLLNIALDWGFQSTSGYVRKAEIVEALEWLRERETGQDPD